VGQLNNACRLAREQISLHLDGELSEFEQVALDAHLTSCAGCRGYGASVAEVSARLRLAPAEQPEFPIVLPHRARIRVPLRSAQVAAAAVVVAVFGLSVAGVTPGNERALSGRTANAPANRAPNLAAWRGARVTVDVVVQRPASPPSVHGPIQIT
jgi:predicted anti-sigma-YlaC factor YlaD